MADRLTVSVTFDPSICYIGRLPELHEPIVALSLGALRRRVEALMVPEQPIIVVSLDRGARLERDRLRNAVAKV